MLVVKRAAHRLRLLVDTESEVCHASHCLEDRSVMRSRSGIRSPAERTVIRNQNCRNSRIIDFLKRPYYGMTGVELIVGTDFGIFHDISDGHGAMEIVRVCSPKTRDGTASLSP